MSSNGGFQSFGMGDGSDGHIGQKTTRFKAEGGRKYRISFAWWATDDDGRPVLVMEDDEPAKPLTIEGNPNFIGANISYIEGVGYVVNKGPEYTKLAGKPPTQRVATVIIVWPLSKDGKLDTARLKEGDVFPWIFAGTKYAQLKAIHNEFPLGAHDVILNCEDTQYQKMTFTPCRDSVLAKLLSNPKAAPVVGPMLEQVAEYASKLKDELGREMTIEQVQEKLGGGAATGGGGPAPAAGADADIDDIVDGMLD